MFMGEGAREMVLRASLVVKVFVQWGLETTEG